MGRGCSCGGGWDNSDGRECTSRGVWPMRHEVMRMILRKAATGFTDLKNKVFRANRLHY